MHSCTFFFPVSSAKPINPGVSDYLMADRKKRELAEVPQVVKCFQPQIPEVSTGGNDVLHWLKPIKPI